ncbi:MAG TPA: adenosine deaminase [Aggregatilinea sp.]|uniref:adenosine deaminase n=1 Tax=Aggregatilinea sp. TaxID=2806333 RepID=UPI002C5D6778|nr:adenosine deaminase [Aggregatilinea sp.]HML24254.1 adenosine deaminase [Aggregatilinea sp.]
MNDLYAPYELSDALAQRLQAMPKVEIHVHLEGATDADTVWGMAKRNGVALPAASLDEWRAFYEFRDFDHFIQVYMSAAACMQTVDDFIAMTESFIQRQAQQNVRYCEVFLSASLLLDKIPEDELIDAFIEGARSGEEKYGTRVAFIPDIGRNLPDTRFRVLDFVLKGQDRGAFIGLGLGGAEVGFPPEMFTDVYDEAARHGLHLVAHAGETEGPASIWGALRSLHAERIGHGVRALDDDTLVDYLRETQIPLEVSPKSNYRLKVVPTDQPHPIRELVDRGVYVTVNSDDPPMFSTRLNDEYLLLAQQGFSWGELWQLNLNGLEATFLNDADKAAYRAEWAAWAQTAL